MQTREQIAFQFFAQQNYSGACSYATSERHKHACFFWRVPNTSATFTLQVLHEHCFCSAKLAYLLSKTLPLGATTKNTCLSGRLNDSVLPDESQDANSRLGSWYRWTQPVVFSKAAYTDVTPFFYRFTESMRVYSQEILLLSLVQFCLTGTDSSDLKPTVVEQEEPVEHDARPALFL